VIQCCKPGRRIGLRGDATRAPDPGPKLERRRASCSSPSLLASSFGPNAKNPRGSGGLVPQFKKHCLQSACELLPMSVPHLLPMSLP